MSNITTYGPQGEIKITAQKGTESLSVEVPATNGTVLFIGFALGAITMGAIWYAASQNKAA